MIEYIQLIMEFNTNQYNTFQKISGGSSLTLIIGALLPWWSGLGSQSGVAYGPGIFTLISGIIGILVVTKVRSSKIEKAVFFLIGVVVLFLTLISFSDIGDSLAGSPDSGLYLSFVAGVLICGSVIIHPIYKLLFTP